LKICKLKKFFSSYQLWKDIYINNFHAYIDTFFEETITKEDDAIYTYI